MAVVRQVFRPVFWAALALILFCGARASAVTIGEYNRTLAGVSDGLGSAARMEHSSVGSAGPMLRRLSDGLPSSMSVTMQDGKVIKADLRWLNSGIHDVLAVHSKERASRIGELAGRVRMSSYASGSVPSSRAAPGPEARTALRRILSRDEYRPSVKDDLALRVIRAISEFIAKVGSLIPERAWGIMGYILIGLAVVAFASALVYLTLRLLDRYVTQRTPERPTALRIERKSKRASLESLLQTAEQEASRSRYREAFRSIYMATIFLLDRAQLVTYAEGSTNWEYMRILKRQAKADQTRLFGDMTLLFDSSIYGRTEVSQQDYLQSKDRFHQLEATL